MNASRRPPQFSIRTLLLLTAWCAVVAAAARLLVPSGWFGVAMVVYFSTLSAYVLLRVACISRRYREGRKRVLRRRERLEAEIRRVVK
jgi:hypothetical protein